MDWNARVELFEQLRREHEFGIGTVAGVAAKFGVHRRMVRQAVAAAVPPRRVYPQRVKPKLDAVVAFIDAVLDGDRNAPRGAAYGASHLSSDPEGVPGRCGGGVRRCAITSGSASGRWVSRCARRSCRDYTLGHEAQSPSEDFMKDCRAF